MDTRAPVPDEFGVNQRDVDRAAMTEACLLGVLLVASAVPWAMYAWSEVKTFHPVPALQSIVVAFAGFLATARLLLIPAELILRRLLPRYRRAVEFRKATRRFRSR